MILRLKPKKWLFSAYILAIVLLVALPLNTSNELNDITILRLRGDYFFHILMFLPWMFFHNPAFENLRSGRSYWPLAISFWSAAKTKDKSNALRCPEPVEGSLPKGKMEKVLTANSQQPTAKSQHLSWLLTGLLFAPATEGLQYFLPYRAFNVNDLIANMLGVITSFVILILYNISAKSLIR